ncbi:VRR-NUC domain-containing protein [uncultured Psychrobacter sp.]|uniref:VRR-NUC domain-containing protein n=1 Tax=uncultured Psychrobacter sp. TaxID=259303 RepID=UPI0034587B5C
MSLKKQCEELNLELHILELNYQGKPEKAVLNHFKLQGCIGTTNEGFMLQNTLKALMLDELTKLNTFNSRNDACTRFLEAQLTIHEHSINIIIESIKSTSRLEFKNNLTEIISALKFKGMEDGLSLEVGLALFDALNTETFINLARKFSQEPYTYRKGWPDLTIVKNSQLKLIEVKTTDKLHTSQIKTIPMLVDVLGDNISVLKVVKKCISDNMLF